MTELEDLALSFFGYMFVSSAGVLTFIDKNTGSQTPVVSISQSQMLKDIGNPQPWTIRRSVVKLRFHVRKSFDNAVVWQTLDSDPPIGPGDTKSFFVSYTYNGFPAFLSDSGGGFWYNVAQSLSPFEQDGTFPDLSFSIASYGAKAYITYENTYSYLVYLFPGEPDNSDSATINGTYIKGDITWTERADTISNPRNPSSVVNPRVLVLDSLWYQNRNQAYDFVDNYQAFISVSQKTPIIQIENRFAEQFTPDLFDVITVDIPALGISSEDMRVGGIEETSLNESTQSVLTTFYLEPFVAQDATTGIWDTSTWDNATWGW